MLLNANRSHLLVVDVQARLMPAIHESDSTLKNINTLLRAALRLGVPVTVSEQYPKGLGPTVASVAEALPAATPVFVKTSFSAAADPATAEHMVRLRGEGRDQLVICGAEAHICVLQSALGFKATGLETFVVADAVSSRSPHSVSAACARLLHAGCHWVTTEMVAFEWMERAATEDFRALSPLFK
ncbi:hydrolase [Microvirga makkahensis]|uniref:Isochorismatase family protein n=1 Tax=Microvirga makkahensis TaxID=1128670 RepID=A0A7X3SRC9_9HYPH|nr:hydrolase [Microvirga makkahensis]MXQ14496.1 isochorismatase family protein [Microvirga makkahensis]